MSKKIKTAIKKGDVTTVTDLIETNPDFLNPAIFEAVDVGNVDIVKLLLEKGADVNLQVGDDDATLLYIATEKGRKDMVKILLENGANVDIPANVFINGTYVERSPLSLAVIKLMQGWVPAYSSSYYRDTIKILLQYGADIYKKDKNDRSPLEIAENNPDIKALLLEEDKKNKIVQMDSIYGKHGLGLGDNGLDVESRKDLYSFLGGKKRRKSTRKQKSSKNKRKQSKKVEGGKAINDK
jgi:ankyrin repeat protein